MKNFQRNNLLFSLCGLNCSLCPMNLNQYCPGCGGGEGNQSCSIAKCSIQHGNVEYCFQCENYPCKKYDNIILGEALWGQRVVHTLLSFVQVADEVDAKGATIGCRSFCISNLPQSVLK